jgi:hypothetical protein
LRGEDESSRIMTKNPMYEDAPNVRVAMKARAENLRKWAIPEQHRYPTPAKTKNIRA